MNTPQLKNCCLPLAAALIALVSSATAATTVTMTAPANPGQYVATPNSSSEWTTGPTMLGAYSTRANVGSGKFWTFCLESNEYFTNPGTYDVGFSDRTDGQGDVISVGTAYLYELFVTGKLFGTEVSPAYTTAQGETLQRAIWFLEDEFSGIAAGSTISNISIAGTNLTTMLTNEFGSIANAKLNYTVGAVGVMNLTSGSNKEHHQDQLIFHGASPQGTSTVPDGGASMILLGISLGGLGIARRFARA